MNLENLSKLYIHELKDLYSVEKQLLDTMPDLLEKCSDSDLCDLVVSGLEDADRQKRRIEDIMTKHRFSPDGHSCKGMQGILEEAKEVLKEVQDPAARDVAIVSMCNRIQHYQLAGYGTARAFAEQLRYYAQADKLIESMTEESKLDHKLSTLAWRKINALATEALKSAA